jgi:hypothetical protein
MRTGGVAKTPKWNALQPKIAKDIHCGRNKDNPTGPLSLPFFPPGKDKSNFESNFPLNNIQ